jgi:alcohol dehydrogenase class IV
MTASVVCEHGALAGLPGALSERQCHKIFLVTGGKSYESSGAESALDAYLDPYSVTRFSDIQENPKLEQLERGLAEFGESQSDLIIAVGGGSVMDMAKLIKIFSAQEKPVLDYVEGAETLTPSSWPLVAIPTTAGSGSQATHFAVLYVGNTKYSVAHPSMLPDAALVDPGLLRSVPTAVAASTGLDALNQGIESYWSIHSTDESKAFAREAIELVWQNLRQMVQNPDDDARLAMATAAHRAGEAIDITKTTAPHAISYPITSFFGVPHGHAVGLVLASMLEFNASVGDKDCLDERGPAYVRDTITEIAGLMGLADANRAAGAYDALMDEIGLSRDFRSLGIESRADLETIIANGFNPQRVNNNPRRVTEAALREMLIGLQDER